MMKLYAGAFLLISLGASLSDGLYTSSDDVFLFDSISQFNDLIGNTNDFWVIEFYADWCGHCKNFASEYKQVAKALKGVIKVGAINGDKLGSLMGRFNVQGFPTVLFFSDNRDKPITYTGARTAQALAQEAMKQLQDKVFKKTGGSSGGGSSGGPGGDVIELDENNFKARVFNNGKGAEDDWLLEFYAPWCGHCKNLAPEWAKAATQLKGKVKVGAVDATVHRGLASTYGIQGFPTIKFIPKGSTSASDAQDYEGGRTASDIVAFGLSKYEENITPPDVYEVVDQSVLEEACSKNSLCVVAILPQLLDCQSACRNEYLKMLKAQTETFKKNRWGWIWAEAGAQPELESAFEMGGFGYPAMVVANVKKQKFSTLRGSFDKDGVKEFLRDLAYGRGVTASLRSSDLPQLTSRSPWDGKDGEMPVMEEIDLSDVELEPLKEEL